MAPKTKSVAPAKAAAPAKDAKKISVKKPVTVKDGPAAILERRKALPPLKKSKVKQSKNDIKVIKRNGGAARFVKRLRTLRNKLQRNQVAKRSDVAKQMKEAKRAALVASCEGKTTKQNKPLKNIRNKDFIYQVKKMRKSYSTQLAPRYLPSSNTFRDSNIAARPRTTRLRKTLVPGTVCILLAGKYKGSRVVYLKQLKRSGLCLVTGPFKLNNVPMRRMNQKYMIATSVRVNLEGVKVPRHIKDVYFKKQIVVKKKKTTSATGEDIFETKKTTKGPNGKRKADQKAMDVAVLGAIKKDIKNRKMILSYLKTKFAVMGRRYPHDIKF